MLMYDGKREGDSQLILPLNILICLDYSRHQYARRPLGAILPPPKGQRTLEKASEAHIHKKKGRVFYFCIDTSHIIWSFMMPDSGSLSFKILKVSSKKI